MVRIHTKLITSLAISLMMAASSLAQELTVAPAESGEQPMVFDIADLEAMPQTSFTTATIWTEGTHEFTGVTLKDFLEATDATADKIRLIALNDYAIEVPATDAVVDGPIIAYRMNGEAMSVRDKGPFWLVYPYDANPEYRSETIYSRSIWQIDRVQVH